MTIEVLPDSPSLGMSPRISFSYDLSQSDVVPVEEYIRTTSSSTIDFDFCVFRESFDHESSTADELFFNGQILPIEIKRKLSPPLPPTTPRRTANQQLPPPAPLHPPRKPRIPGNESKNPNCDSPEEKQRSFWRFKRSSSLNCGNGYGRTLCPLPLLSRSNSTGSSSAAVKRSTIANNPKQTFFRQQSSHKQNQSYSSKPPLKRSGHGFPASNGVKFNPVLHVPSPNLFGLGSIFSIGKDRSRKKR